MLKAVAKEREVQPNLVIRSVGKTRNVITVARKAIHCPIVIKVQRKKKRMITNQEHLQQAVLSSCART